MEFDAALKGVSGKIQVTSKTINWNPKDGTPVKIDLLAVSGMKATPPTAAKARIQLQTSDAKFVFDFANRPDLDASRDCLQKAIKSVREQQDSGTATPEASVTATATPESGSTTPAPSKAKAIKRKKMDLSPKVLLANLDLQREILKKNRDLMLVFQEVVVKGSLTNEQFWEMRMELLQTAALENGQARGSYNVLSTIKPTTTSDNKINLSLTREKIHDLFDQYPIVRKAYNENVPPLSEGTFWQRFFMSRLFLQLRGERVANSHPFDTLIDKYIDVLEEQRLKRKLAQTSGEKEHHVPVFFDVAANSENNPETIGNTPDVTMKLQYSDMAASRLIKSMNQLSKRLLLSKKGPAGTTGAPSLESVEELTNELRLGDLDSADNQGSTVDLHVAEPMEIDDALEIPEQEFQNKRQALFVQIADKPLDLCRVGEDPEALTAAHGQIQNLVAQQALQNEKCDTVELPEEAYLCHAATLEFLKHFWRAHNRHEPTTQYVEALQKSLQRIEAVVASSGPHIKDVTETALAPLVKSVNKALSTATNAQ